MPDTSVVNGGRKQKMLFKCSSRDAAPLILSGDAPELGQWDPSAGIALHSQPRQQGGFEWTCQAELPLGHTIEYKFVQKTDHGMRWESGYNRRFTVIPGMQSLDADFRE